ncbi:hypothetical protein SAMN02745216_03178 [Desulfatibacillum alkenivorans DSM 16219]|jgi:hypothetical protein|uniref:Methyltransferase domain-containing protein n=1 Tax=Desulfatibacillum alkenivorans DSM 16219 TaxID=1121393 RepID=A0A1M6R2W4_9BACT|nr:hypothetical protein [Desulfatibacillum alkenivorans]SHK26845.1 hypothetical protein SAMN02745216_03178 [Desulfatibacillum alkenivorans DSM 16219]
MGLEKVNLTGLQGKTPDFMKPVIRPFARWMFFFCARLLRECYPEQDARLWSNRELKKFADLFSGDIINVSGWKDEDKEGGFYSDYFTQKSSYTVSNVGRGARGSRGDSLDLTLDLESPLPPELHQKYDVAFNHTTLEHVYDVQTSIGNICKLSRDIVIVVVPFLQMVHWEPGSYGDYWRFTPFAMDQMLQENGFHTLYASHNDNPLHAVYLFYVASRRPENWKDRFPPRTEFDRTNAPGTLAFRHIVKS